MTPLDGAHTRCEPPCGLPTHKAAFFPFLSPAPCLPAGPSEGLECRGAQSPNRRPRPRARSLAPQRPPVSLWAGRPHVGQNPEHRGWRTGTCPRPRPLRPNSRLCHPDAARGRRRRLRAGTVPEARAGECADCRGTDTLPSRPGVSEDSGHHAGSGEGGSGHPCLTPVPIREALVSSPARLSFAGCLLGHPHSRVKKLPSALRSRRAFQNSPTDVKAH